MNKLTFTILPSPEPGSNDFQVRPIVDGRDLIRDRWDDFLGMNPFDFMNEKSFLPSSAPQELMIARCSCGEPGCGSAEITLSGTTATVSWKIAPDDELVFDANEYRRAVEAAATELSWEPKDYTAHRLLKPLIDHASLANQGLQFQFASDETTKRYFTLWLTAGGEQFDIRVPWDHKSPEEMAAAAARILSQPIARGGCNPLASG